MSGAPENISGTNQTATGFEEAAAGFVFDDGRSIKRPGMVEAVTDRSYCFTGPELSARSTFKPAQIILILVTLAITAGLFAWSKEAGIIFVSACFSGFYLCVVLFRAAVLAEYRPPQMPKGPIHPSVLDKSYVIVVALYREAGQVENLVKALDQLRWPEGKKKINLVCEIDDPQTINAVLSLRRRDIGLFIVPDGQPRTKPRALNFAVQHVKGDYLVLYDAEDRPHPNQLLEAANRFGSGPDNLVVPAISPSHRQSRRNPFDQIFRD